MNRKPNLVDTCKNLVGKSLSSCFKKRKYTRMEAVSQQGGIVGFYSPDVIGQDFIDCPVRCFSLGITN